MNIVKAKKIVFVVIVLLLAGALCAAFPAGMDQPARPAATATPAVSVPVVSAYPPPSGEASEPLGVESAYPAPTEYIKDPGERGPNDPTPAPVRPIWEIYP